MIFLIFNVLISSVIMVIFKLSAQKGWNGDKIIMMNYVAAAALSLFSLFQSGQHLMVAQLKNADPAALFTQKNLANSVALGIIFGCVQGCMYMIELVVRKTSTAQNGAGLTTFFSKSAFIGILLLSALIWKEYPTAVQWFGIALIIIALILTTGDLKTLRAESPILFLLLMVNGTIIETIHKAVTVYILPEHNPLFLSIVFCMALLLCIGKSIWAARKSGEKIFPNKPEILSGLLLGFVNTLVAWSSLKSLDALPTSIVFPTQAAGNLLLVFILGKAVFHEPSSKKLMISLVIAVVSLILINV